MRICLDWTVLETCWFSFGEIRILGGERNVSLWLGLVSYSGWLVWAGSFRSCRERAWQNRARRQHHHIVKHYNNAALNLKHDVFVALTGKAVCFIRHAPGGSGHENGHGKPIVEHA